MWKLQFGKCGRSSLCFDWGHLRLGNAWSFFEMLKDTAVTREARVNNASEIQCGYDMFGLICMSATPWTMCGHVFEDESWCASLIWRSHVRLVLRGKSSHQAVCLDKVQGLPGSSRTCREDSGGWYGQPRCWQAIEPRTPCNLSSVVEFVFSSGLQLVDGYKSFH